MKAYLFTVCKDNGLHVRMVATLIAKLQKMILNTEKLKNIKLQYKDKTVSITNLLSIVSMKILKNEEVTLIFNEPLSSENYQELKRFFENHDEFEQKEADRLLMENSITMEEALAHLPNGVVIVNKENVITYVNQEAVRLLDTPANLLLNQSAQDVIPHSELRHILQSGKKELAKRQQLKNRMILTNRSPIIFDHNIIGAIALFQDITNIEALSNELNKVKSLQEQLNLVLRSVNDLIGLSDENGKLLFQNSSLTKFIEEEQVRNQVQAIVGNDLWRNLTKNLASQVKVITFKEGLSYIVKLNPTIIDGEFCGTVLTMSPSDDLKLVLEQLDIEKERSHYLELELSKHQLFDKAFDSIIGTSATFRDALSIASKVSRSSATVLITGESGTGKELVAKAIHEASPRQGKPFIRVNCAAIPSHLIESELFGHERGAFTGAVQTRKGKFELANTGTIFLDEIGDLSLDLQSKILRVLQEREIERVGGYQTINLDVRILAATHQNLERMIQEGTYREDLYFRINVVPVHLPPLRKRRSDIPLLVDYFRVQFNEILGKSIKGYEDRFIDTLMNYNWPGNIRELRNIIERLMTLEDGEMLYLNDLPVYILEKRNRANSRETSDAALVDAFNKVMTMDEYEKEIYSHIIQYYPSYNQIGKALGVTHKTVAAKVRKYHLEGLVGKKYLKS